MSTPPSSPQLEEGCGRQAVHDGHHLPQHPARFKDSGSKEFGAAVVTVDGKEVAAYDPRQAGWTHCHAAIILKEETAQRHHIEIKMQEPGTDKVFTILGFGVL